MTHNDSNLQEYIQFQGVHRLHSLKSNEYAITKSELRI